MPTFDVTRRFQRDYRRLSPDQQTAFRNAVMAFVADLLTGRFRRGLRVKGIKGAPGIFEMTWAEGGRATFQYGPEVLPGQPHIVWRRVGTHEVFRSP